MTLGLSHKRMSIYITDNAINILIGNKNKIIDSHSITLGSGICVDGTVKKIEVIIKKIREYIDINARGIKKISFVIGGSDIIIRHIEVPILKREALDNAVNFEFQQFIPEINNYYTNYEIVYKNNTEEKKSYNILLVAVAKEKTNALLEIANALNKELHIVDIASNSIARVLRESNLLSENESTVVFYISSDNCTLSIIEDKALKFERNLPFGLRNLLTDKYDEIIKNKKYIQSKDLEEVLNTNERIKVSFDNVLSTVTNTMRYYNSDRNNKPIGSLVLICEEILIHNIEKNLKKYFTIPLISIREPIDLDIRVKTKDYFPRYIINYGILLRRRNKNHINLNPRHSDKEDYDKDLNKKLAMSTSVAAITLTILVVAFVVINSFISNDINDIKNYLDRYSSVIEENEKLVQNNNKIQDLINRLEQVKDNALSTSDTLSKLNTYIPKEIQFTSLSLNASGNININGESKTYEAVSVFLANLLSSDDFNKAKINYINPIEKTVTVDNYSFRNIKQEGGTTSTENKGATGANSSKSIKVYNFSITIEGVILNEG